MPVYTYRCKVETCKCEFEVYSPRIGAPTASRLKCPSCGEKVERVFNGPMFLFKGEEPTECEP